MTTAQSLVVVGAGGHGLEAYDIACEAGFDVAGFVDDSLATALEVQKTRVALLGKVQWLIENPQGFVLAVAAPATRRDLARHLASSGCEPTSVIHPKSGIGSGVSIGGGVIVPQGCRVSIGATLGEHVHLGAMSNIAHGCVLGDFVTVTPGVMVSGDCVVGDGVWLGAGCVINQGVSIGSGATVGSGAVVLSDVAPGTTVVGIPARSLDQEA